MTDRILEALNLAKRYMEEALVWELASETENAEKKKLIEEHLKKVDDVMVDVILKHAKSLGNVPAPLSEDQDWPAVILTIEFLIKNSDGCYVGEEKTGWGELAVVQDFLELVKVFKEQRG